MDIFLSLMAALCFAIGIAGSLLPGLPGPPFSWIGLLLAGFTSRFDSSPTLLLVTASVAVLITVMDIIIPSLTTKRFGGSKYGVWGCNLGLVLSLFGLPFGPTGLLGMAFWPFVGAVVGELIHSKIKNQKSEIITLPSALKAGCGAFVGFLSGTFLKFAYAVAIPIVVIFS